MIRPPGCLIYFIVLGWLGMPAFLLGDDPPAPKTPASEPAAQQEPPAGDKPAQETSDGERPAVDGAGDADPLIGEDELLRDLAPEAIDEEAAMESLDRAVEEMRKAHDRLSKGDTDTETLSLQETAVKQLDRLIELLKKPPPRNPQQKQQQQNQNQDQQDQQNQQQQQQQQNQQQRQQRKQKKMSKLQRQLQRQRQQQQQSQQQQRQQQPQMASQQRQQQRQQQQNENEAKNPTDSDRRLRNRKDEQAAANRQRDVLKDVWGHLPPNLRAELQSLYNEKYLPKYEDQVRRYFEALADRSRETRNSSGSR